MPIPFMPGAARRLLVPILLLSAMPALAQLPSGAVVQPFSRANDPAELLAQALRTLATDPGNLAALTAAGRNAVILGDPNAAVGFFGRAQEIAPRDGQVKAGLGSALVQLEKPRDALRLFADASRLGVPDADIAEDRGLAYDLTGQSRLAQQDYQTVLAARPDDDTARRRLALSQGISGDKAAAIATLDPLIRKRDIAGWRAQTFVLAMDGDAKGAGDITRIMLPQQAAMLQPFLVRLATLSSVDKARAVHFGEMPATGRAYTPTQVASVDAPATYAAAPARSPAPRSDLAPPVRVAAQIVPRPAVTPRPVIAAAPAQKVVQSVPAPSLTVSMAPIQRASLATQPTITSQSAIATHPTVATPAVAHREYAGPPLAAIALTPATPQPATVTPVAVAPLAAPAAVETATPSVASVAPPQIAQAAPAVAPVAPTPPPTPAASTPALPMPAAEGHYDLPHDAAMRSGARASRPASSPVKTVGTPVVHGKSGASSSSDGAVAKPAAGDEEAPTKPAKIVASKKPAAKDSATQVAATDDEDCARPAKSRSRHGKVSTRCKASTSKDRDALADADKTASSSDDCGPLTKSRGAHARGRKPSSHCTASASSKSDETVTAKDETASSLEADCAPTAKTKSRSRHHKVSTRCTRLATSDDTDTTFNDKATSSADEDCAPHTRSHSRSAKNKATSRCTKLADSATDVPTKSHKETKGSASDTDSDAGKSVSKSVKSEKAGAEKYYVQVAGGANKDDLDKAWTGVKKKAPDLMKGHKPLTTPLRATNRLLVGPFKDEDEAQAFVNKMAGKGLSGFTVKSGKGQKVEKIDAGP